MSETTSTSATAVNKQLLKDYVAAAEAKATTARPAASERQIYRLMALVQTEDVATQKRINVYTALRGGISKRHASVLIDQLLGKFGQHQSPPTPEPVAVATVAAPAAEAEITGDEPLPWDLPALALRAPAEVESEPEYSEDDVAAAIAAAQNA